jgi:hypothetical protein
MAHSSDPAGSWLHRIVHTLATRPEVLAQEVTQFRLRRPGASEAKLAEQWADRIVRLYASEGAATALPSIIPGPGTLAQIAIEGGAISVDLAFMVRCMARMTAGIASLYGHDVKDAYTRDFIYVMGLWTGVLLPAREATKKVAGKVAVAQFNRRVPGAVFQRINRRVGTTILTKYGTKRGGIAVGRLVPFGVGAAVGGGFNYVTMRSFRRAALRYYSERPDLAEQD